jgi:predicted GNAT family N-acyltransferase
MVTIELMSWENARGAARPIRFAVFVEEQGVPSEIEIDEMDAKCVHAVALEAGTAVGTGRLLPDAHIGRIAVLEPWRRRGIGGLILASLMAKAKERGDTQVVLAAQVHAAGFYRRHGFEPLGAVFKEAGIDHQTMRRNL